MRYFQSLAKSFLDLPEDSRRLAAFRAIVIGLAAGLSALALENGAYWLSFLRVKACSTYPAWIVLPGFGLLGGLISGFLVQKYSPMAYGSGIPQVRAYLLGAKQPLDIKLAIVKLISGSIALGSGLFLGREGPTVHVGAAIAVHLNKLFPDCSKEQKNQLIASGAGAGLAAAFNAPIAGVLFVAEELLKDVSTNTVGTAILACFVASALTHVFNAPHREALTEMQAIPFQFTFHDVFFWVVLGFVSGIVGVWFNRGVIFFLKLNRDYVKIPPMLRVGLAGLISGAVIALIPADAHFRDYAALRDVIVAGNEAWYMVPFAFIAFFFLTLLAYGSGAPGGLFAPAIVLGSALGVMVSYVENYFFGVGSVEIMAMVGMGAFFAAVARVPMTAVVIVTEITKHYNLVPPLMVAVATACFVGSRMEKGSVYDMLREYGGLNEQIKQAQEEANQPRAKDLMQEQFILNVSEQNADWKKALLDNFEVNEFAVVKDGKFLGLINGESVKACAQFLLSEDLELSQVVEKDLRTVSPDTPLREILELFKTNKRKTLAVVDDGTVVGMIHERDLRNIGNTASSFEI